MGESCGGEGEGSGGGGPAICQRLLFFSFGVRLCPLLRGSGAPASPHPLRGTQGRAAPSAAPPKQGEPVPPPPPPPRTGRACPAPPVTDVPALAGCGRGWRRGPGSRAATECQGLVSFSGGSFIQGSWERRDGRVSETYFCSYEAGCDAVASPGCAAPPAPAPPLRAGPAQAPPALPPAALAQPPAASRRDR